MYGRCPKGKNTQSEYSYSKMLSSCSHANVPRDITESAAQTSRTSMPRGKKRGAQYLQMAKLCDSHSVSVRKQSSENIALYRALCSKEYPCQTAGLWMCTGAAQRRRTTKRLALRRSYLFSVQGRIQIQLMIWRVISSPSRTFYRKYKRMQNRWYTHLCIAALTIEEH